MNKMVIGGVNNQVFVASNLGRIEHFYSVLLGLPLVKRTVHHLDPRLPVISAARFGDLSYGLYIYGWPVEEAVMWFSGGHAAWWQVFLMALPAASAIAFLSWHLVERPMLRLKPGARRGAARYAPAAQQA